jgi:DNA-binding LacI/PurR family transcriptional regulator
MYSGLTGALKFIANYQKIILLFDEIKQPQGLLKGFKIFCEENKIEYEIVDSLESRRPLSGEIYVIPDDRSLIKIIKKIRQEKLVLANEIGIISYNDTLLKEIVEGGITTISTDFNHMGKRLAEMILNNENLKIENPNRLIIRRSI